MTVGVSRLTTADNVYGPELVTSETLVLSCLACLVLMILIF